MAVIGLRRCVAAILVTASLTGCAVAAGAAPSPSATASAGPSTPRPSAPAPSTIPEPIPAATPTPTTAPTPLPSAEPTQRPSAGNASYCHVADVVTPSTSYEDPFATYLDWTNRLPAEYAPPDLVNAVTGSRAAGASLLVRALVWPELARLRAAALADGHLLVVVSAYRSYALQAQTFDYWTGVGGYEQALRTSARPGHSEHQLGTAIDFGDGSGAPWDYADWAQTPAGAWLASHAAEFGFVMSYPKGRTAVTCYAYEPWHYRYVGPALAKELVATGLSLREFQSLDPAHD
jgi:zinc D-Ala-D-Ala carboxypeptidase